MSTKCTTANIGLLLWGLTEENPGITPLFNFGYGVDRLLTGFTFKIKIRFFNLALRLGGLSNNPPQQQACHVVGNPSRTFIKIGQADKLMKRKTFLIAFIVGLLTFLLGWFLKGNLKFSNQAKESDQITSLTHTTANPDSMKINSFANTVSGNFILTESNCAGFNFIDTNIILWTNEIACNDPDTLKIRWLSDSTFMTRSTLRVNESCPPRVDIYKVIAFDGKHLTLKSISTGWNDSKDQSLEFIKQSN